MAKNCCKLCCCGCCSSEQVNSIENLIVENEETQEVTLEPTHKDSITTLAFPLPQPLLTGHYLFVEGTTDLRCTRFAINLTCGTEVDADKAFHFNPRLEEDYVVRNSYINSKWGDEEVWFPYKVKFIRPGKFKVAIFIASDRFLVSIQDKHYCHYKFRIALTKITHLTISGHLTVEAFYIRESTEYPSKEVINIPTLPLEKPNQNGPLPNPFTAKLPENLTGKWQLEIIGKVKLLPHSFYVNLQEGFYIWPHPTIPLHLNPRFYAGEHIVVRNAWHNGSWSNETRGLCQFFPGHKFHLIIRWEGDEFSIWVNGKMTGMFRSISREHTVLDTVHAQGDFVLYKIWVNKHVKSIMENMEDYSKEVFSGEL